MQSLRNLAHTMLGAVQTRVELFANELEEQGARLARIAILLGLAAFCAGMAIVLATVLVVVLFWDANRYLALGLLAGFFLACAIATALAARSVSSERPRTLSGTISELARDREALQRTEAP
jgi:uncharacterized membrane protein YqjE